MSQIIKKHSVNDSSNTVQWRYHPGVAGEGITMIEKPYFRDSFHKNISASTHVHVAAISAYPIGLKNPESINSSVWTLCNTLTYWEILSVKHKLTYPFMLTQSTPLFLFFNYSSL